MADEKKHNRGANVGKFCDIAKDGKCGCSKNLNYRETGKPNSKNWNKFLFFPAFKKDTGKFSKYYEAHHLVCVASVEEYIVAAADTKLFKGVLENTEWCVNEKVNMLAMPVWGHTIFYYCFNDLDDPPAPPFANIPMHNFDHLGKGRYKSEVDEAMQDVVRDLKEMKNEHKINPEDIYDAIIDWSKEFRRRLLEERGIRSGGTHQAWENGKDGEEDWCKPFSMASDAFVPKRGFPKFDNVRKKWIQRIQKAISGK